MEDSRKGPEDPWTPDATLRNCPEPILGMTPNGVLETWNPAAERLLGFTKDDVLGRSLFDLLAPALDVSPEQLRERLRTGEPPPYSEGTVRRKDGTAVEVALVLSGVKDGEGHPVALVGALRDLRGSKNTADQLRRSRDLLNRAEKVALLGSWEWEVERDLVAWSEELYDIFGIAPGGFEATLQAFLARIHPEDRQRVRDTVNATVVEGRPFDFHHRLIRPDGVIRFVRCKGQLLFEQGTSRRRLVGICQDVTDLRSEEQRFLPLVESEVARREAAERQALLLSRASLILTQFPDIQGALRQFAALAADHVGDVCLVDLFTPEGTLRRVAIGCRDPALRENIEAQFHGATPGVGVPEIARILENRRGRLVLFDSEEVLPQPTVTPSELEALRSLRVGSAVIVPIQLQGRTLGALTFLRFSGEQSFGPEDARLAEGLAYRIAVSLENAELFQKTATEAEVLRASDEKLRGQNVELERRVRERTAQLRGALNELEAFAYSVAHDLRAPLRAMRGFSQILLEAHSTRLDEAGRDYLSRISVASARLDGLIQDLLEYSRIGRSTVELKSLPMEAVLKTVVKEMEPEFRERRADVRMEGFFPSVFADQIILVRVVTNILSNAVKFVAPGVRPRVRIWSEDRGVQSRLWIEDNGIGIPPEHHERIFRVFERLNRLEDYPGTGIGLAIVRRGVERMKGRTGVESEAGRGSRFWIELDRV